MLFASLSAKKLSLRTIRLLSACRERNAAEKKQTGDLRSALRFYGISSVTSGVVSSTSGVLRMRVNCFQAAA